MTYTEAKAKCAEVETRVCAAGAALKAFPKGSMGLTPDAVKASPEYKAAKAEFDAAFFAQRQINRFINKHFKQERLADVRARRNIFG